MSYRIVTESTCDLPRSFYKEHDIDAIGMLFQLDGREYREDDSLSITSKQFYDALREGKASTTMQVNTFEFCEFVEPFLQKGEDVLYVAFSSGLSGTCDSARRGAEQLREKYPGRRVEVVDTLAASMGQGLLVYYADVNRRSGMTLEENAAWLESHKLRLCHWFTVDDLMHLHRGGRVSKTSAIVGSLLGIKPVLHVDDEGHLILVSKARGRAASIEAIADKAVQTADPALKEQTVFISHGDCRDDAERLAELLKKKSGASVALISSIGSVIGSHSGPGTLAVFFLGRQR